MSEHLDPLSFLACSLASSMHFRTGSTCVSPKERREGATSERREGSERLAWGRGRGGVGTRKTRTDQVAVLEKGDIEDGLDWNETVTLKLMVREVSDAVVDGSLEEDEKSREQSLVERGGGFRSRMEFGVRWTGAVSVRDSSLRERRNVDGSLEVGKGISVTKARKDFQPTPESRRTSQKTGISPPPLQMRQTGLDSGKRLDEVSARSAS